MKIICDGYGTLQSCTRSVVTPIVVQLPPGPGLKAVISPAIDNITTITITIVIFIIIIFGVCFGSLILVSRGLQGARAPNSSFSS